MAPLDAQPARDRVLADLTALERRRRRALAVGSLVLGGAAAGAILWRGPLGPRAIGAAVSLAIAAIGSLAIALGVPMIPATTARLLSVVCTVLAVVGGVLLGGAFVPWNGLGLSCLAQGVLAGALALVALSLSMSSLWRRSIDVRWPASLGATAVVLAVGASLCAHEGALHMWVAHLPIVPAVYALARSAAHLVRDRGSLA